LERDYISAGGWYVAYELSGIYLPGVEEWPLVSRGYLPGAGAALNP